MCCTTHVPVLYGQYPRLAGFLDLNPGPNTKPNPKPNLKPKCNPNPKPSLQTQTWICHLTTIPKASSSA